MPRKSYRTCSSCKKYLHGSEFQSTAYVCKACAREYQMRVRADVVAGKIGVPPRIRSAPYLAHVRGQACLACGLPGEAHHLTFAQPRALAKKTGDQFVVPLCHPCHMDLHQSPMPEKTWWALRGIYPMKWAEKSYQKWMKDHGAF